MLNQERNRKKTSHTCIINSQAIKQGIGEVGPEGEGEAKVALADLAALSRDDGREAQVERGDEEGGVDAEVLEEGRGGNKVTHGEPGPREDGKDPGFHGVEQ